MMFFKRPDKIWRYSKPIIERGYVSIPWEEKTLLMDVQTLEDVTITTSDGTRTVQRLKVFCDEEILVEDEDTQQKGDRLVFQKKLFECNSCRYSGNTPLKHYLATFIECLDKDELREIIEGGGGADNEPGTS